MRSVNFGTGGSGGLEISDDHADETALRRNGRRDWVTPCFTTIRNDYIDLTSVTFVSAGTITGSYNAGTHVLTVSSGGTVVAAINIGGAYSTANFHFSSGANDTVEITDPAVSSGGHVHHDHVGHSANLGLLANYIANFGAEAHGLLISSTGQTETAQPLIAHPHG